MLVTGRELVPEGSFDAMVECVLAAVRGGVSVVQLREKDMPLPEMEHWCRMLRSTLPEDVALVVNAPREVGMRGGADGYHLPEIAAEETDQDRGVFHGRSVHSLESAVQRCAGCSYIIAGNIFETSSHSDRPAKGLTMLRRISEAVPVPVIAIGGITPERVRDCVRAGAAGIAVRSPILSARYPEETAREFHAALQGAWSVQRRCRTEGDEEG